MLGGGGPAASTCSEAECGQPGTRKYFYLELGFPEIQGLKFEFNLII